MGLSNKVTAFAQPQVPELSLSKCVPLFTKKLPLFRKIIKNTLSTCFEEDKKPWTSMYHFVMVAHTVHDYHAVFLVLPEAASIFPRVNVWTLQLVVLRQKLRATALEDVVK